MDLLDEVLMVFTSYCYSINYNLKCKSEMLTSEIQSEMRGVWEGSISFNGCGHLLYRSKTMWCQKWNKFIVSYTHSNSVQSYVLLLGHFTLGISCPC